MKPELKLTSYYIDLALTFPSYVIETLNRIDNDLQILALRRYIRKRGDLNTQWAWSETRVKQYLNSPQYTQVRTKIDLVKTKFASMNPGYSLGVSPIRDLSRQIRLWNHNKKVRTAASYLQTNCIKDIESSPDLIDRESLNNFKSYLEHSHVNPEPTSAAPGLSDHGQMNAVDFVILQGQKQIAGTSTSSIPIVWEGSECWAQKLNVAVIQSGSGFHRGSSCRHCRRGRRRGRR